MRQVILNRKAKGLCAHCGKRPHIEGRENCAECLKYYKDRMDALRTQGLCAKCHQPSNGKAYCKKCVEYYKELRKTRLKQGLCDRCNEPNNNGKTVCNECAKYSHGWVENHKLNKICVKCSKPAANGKSTCQNCLDARNNLRKLLKLQGLCIRCGKNQADNGKTYCIECAKMHSIYYDKKRKGRRLLVIKQYGGKCDICNETNLDLLCIDHINNDGAEHRKQLGGGGDTTYSFLIKNNYPSNCRLLCWNCNEIARCLSIQPPKNARNKAGRKCSLRIKVKILNAYGGCFCKNCGNTDVRVLVLDHIDGGGYKHRKDNGINDSMIGWAYKQQKKTGTYPPLFQVLCRNCNEIKRIKEEGQISIGSLGIIEREELINGVLPKYK